MLVLVRRLVAYGARRPLFDAPPWAERRTTRRQAPSSPSDRLRECIALAI
jgi:hypothetical protein